MEKQINSKRGRGKAQSLSSFSTIHQSQEELAGSAFCFFPSLMVSGKGQVKCA